MDEVEFIQVKLPVDEYEVRIRNLVQILLEMDEETEKLDLGLERNAA